MGLIKSSNYYLSSGCYRGALIKAATSSGPHVSHHVHRPAGEGPPRQLSSGAHDSHAIGSSRRPKHRRIPSPRKIKRAYKERVRSARSSRWADWSNFEGVGGLQASAMASVGGAGRGEGKRDGGKGEEGSLARRAWRQYLLQLQQHPLRTKVFAFVHVLGFCSFFRMQGGFLKWVGLVAWRR